MSHYYSSAIPNTIKNSVIYLASIDIERQRVVWNKWWEKRSNESVASAPENDPRSRFSWFLFINSCYSFIHTSFCTMVSLIHIDLKRFEKSFHRRNLKFLKLGAICKYSQKNIVSVQHFKNVTTDWDSVETNKASSRNVKTVCMLNASGNCYETRIFSENSVFRLPAEVDEHYQQHRKVLEPLFRDYFDHVLLEWTKPIGWIILHQKIVPQMNTHKLALSESTSGLPRIFGDK